MNGYLQDAAVRRLEKEIKQLQKIEEAAQRFVLATEFNSNPFEWSGEIGNLKEALMAKAKPELTEKSDE